MINGRQIRAARGLLKWSAVTLAEKAGLTRETINKIEDDIVQPREGTVADIVRVFDENGVEFTDNSGVRLKPQGVEILIGQIGLQQFFDNVYDHARRHGGPIVQFGIDEQKFLTYLESEFSQDYMGRMAEVSREKKNLSVRAIICEGDTNFLASQYNEYRWISKDVFQAVPFYIYGETLAIMDFQTVPAPTIVVLKFPAITNAYRAQFEAFWKIAQNPNQLPAPPLGAKSKRK
ncbi:MAG TPA: helix-turn-helix transcriptional regulator [Alphaproteobacteria bacterium]|nr:helix-turn-helix transcriptional regulator [Alphaproteobacteria bacterium]